MKKSIIFLATLMAFSANAASKKERDNLQGHVSEQRGSIVSEEMLSNLEAITNARSELKNKEDLANREKAYLLVESEKTRASLGLAREVFIKKNVPIEYVIAGEKAVEQYIVDNFINKDPLKAVSDETLWASNNTALTANETVTLPSPISSQVRVEPAAVLPVVTPPPAEKDEQLSEEEKERIAASLGALGISIDQAGDIAEKKNERPAEETAQKNVLIQKIDIQRVVIMGKINSLDAVVYFNVMNGFNNRDISMPMSNMSPGTEFLVDNVPFMLSQVSDEEVVFTNMETGIQFKEYVR